MRLRYIMYRRKNKRKLIIIILILMIAIIIDCQLRPLIKTVSATQANIVSTNAINEAVLEQLNKESITYDDLVTTQKDSDGRILAITTNMQKINLLKSNIALAVQSKLRENRIRRVGIPIGTLTNTDILNGKGPNIPLDITLSGAVIADFKSDFTTAGINQTKHQIYLNIKTKVSAIIPGYPTRTAIDTNVMIAETIIVGEVPNVFANMDSSRTSALADLSQTVQ